MTQLEYTRDYIAYAEDVVFGNIKTGEAIKLACKRFLDWFKRDDIYFDYEDVDKKIRFVHKMKHSTGAHAGKPFTLLPWQQWCFANIFGWKYVGSGNRVTQKVFMMLSRKSGKTALAAAIGICCAVCDNENGAEVDLVANSREQASIAFEHTKNFCTSLDQKKKVLKPFRNYIKIPATKSTIQVLSSDSMGNDGYNSSCFILDEFHAQKDWNLYNVMVSSQGMRLNPLAIIITTAGFLVGSVYPCWSMWSSCMEILRGLKEDDTQFSAIYQLDEQDDWQDEKQWIKCCPTIGQTVTYAYMRRQINDAKNNAALETGIKTKNLNMWCNSKEIWIPDELIQKVSAPVNMDDFLNEDCYAGVDLSSVGDITAVTFMFVPNADRKVYPDKFVFISKYYLPESALNETSNAGIYNELNRTGHLNITSGNCVDYDYILGDILKVQQKTQLMQVAYDKWNATQFAINATNEGLPLEPYSQNLGSFNAPTKALERLIRTGQCVIDNSPVTRWMFTNCELKYDWNENCKPVKANNNKTNKIDGVITIIESLGSYLLSPQYVPEVIPI